MGSHLDPYSLEQARRPWFASLSGGSVGLYQKIVDSLAEGVGIVDDSETIRFANPAFALITGYPVDELVGMHLTRLIPDDEFAKIEEQTALRRSGIATTYDTTMIRADGVPRIIRVHARPLAGTALPFSGTLGVVEDVTERVRTAERFRALTEYAHDIIAEFGPDLRARYVSPGTEQVLGYTQAEMDALTLEDLVDTAELSSIRKRATDDIQARREHATVTTRANHRTGRAVWLELNLSYVYAGSGDLERIVVVMRDVTSRVTAHQEIERQRSEIETLLEEKNLLLREVYHRVKNDLSLVKSLLQLQASAAGDSKVESQLADAGRRVQTIANVYDRLYRADDLQELDLRAILTQLVSELRSSVIRPAVHLRVDGESLSVPPRIGVAVATIVNELIANSLKHGGDRMSEIHVSWRKTGPAGVTFRISDDGPGFPAEQLQDKGGGFGLTIVRALVEQWDGQMRTANDGGATVEVHLEYPTAAV